MKRIISIGLILITCFFPMGYTKADELTDARKQMNSINSSLNSKKDELNNINKQRADVQSTLQELDKKMTVSGDILNSLNDQLSALNSQVLQLQQKIDIGIQQMDSEKQLFKQRVRAMYINGSEGYLELILSAKNLSDFFDKIELAAKLMEYDKNLMNSLETNNTAIALQKAEYDVKMSKTAELKQQADGNMQVLKDTTDKKKQLMTSLERDKISYEKMIEEEEKQSNNIAQIIKDIQRKKEEEKKKALQGSVLQFYLTVLLKSESFIV